MAVPGIPSNFNLTQGNGQIALQWDLTPTAISYIVQRSTDGVTFSTVSSPVVNNYLDAAPTLNTMYYYQVAAVNGSGTGTYTGALQGVPAPFGEQSLFELRQHSKEKADKVNSKFVLDPEWNYFLNLACKELYDLLITVYEDYFMAPAINFTTNGQNQLYPLPNGFTQYANQAGTLITAQAFYKLAGVDLALNSSPNGFVTVNKFNFHDRNKFIYPNTNSTMYGVFNIRYRIIGNQLELIPAPSANQKVQIWYFPLLLDLIKDTDTTTIGYSGWLQYVICRAAKYALDKEESDTTSLDSELLFLKKRIEESAVNRDVGQADTITDVRSGVGYGNDSNGGWNGAIGGF